MTKSELRSMIREILKEELQRKPLSEAAGFSKVSDAQFKKKLIADIANTCNKAVAEMLYRFDFRSTDEIAKNTASITAEDGIINIHTELLVPENLEKAKKAVLKVFKAELAKYSN
jgi:hypothetical protein